MATHIGVTIAAGGQADCGVHVALRAHSHHLQGTLVTLAIGLHNVPEGLAVATVMAAKGTSPRRALLWTALTALPQALVAPPAYVFVDTFRCVHGTSRPAAQQHRASGPAVGCARGDEGATARLLVCPVNLK